MRLGALIQARMTSQRLPGKVLAPLAGRESIAYLVERLQRASRLEAMVIATSEESSDDPVAAFCERMGVSCYRGPLDNVTRRLADAAEQFELGGFVRINGDSPLLDPALVDHGCELFAEEPVDLVTNVFPRSFPAGQSIEVISTRALRTGLAQITAQDELEHVSLHFYRFPDRWRIRNFAAPADYSHLRMTLDTADDLTRVDRIIRSMTRPHWEYGWSELVQMGDGAPLSP